VLVLKNIDVSFCVIAYNHAAYIDRALESISEQAFCGTLEVIIGVDHSKDSTLSEVRKCIEKYNFGGEVFVIAHEFIT
jgi:glycosyltransferase involved in cell wall biosynthesis